MPEVNLAGRCGLYCGACNIYRAQRDDASWRRRLASRFKCEEEQVCCNGCRALTGDCWGYNCKIVICLEEKGFDSCYLCPEHSGNCEKFGKLAAGYLNDGVDIRRNLAERAAAGLEAWLERAAEEYTCRSCGGPLTVGRTQCHHCGAPRR
ncbi:MAG TPA: DUF3795 domain-containing protein [Bacillota bacterium]|jgi:hypothetical protein|nr:DUF3795 domain-containing protein [Bacillota bacterium]HOA35847.1 DUF3795 domain-containing protein [Bacillota bacterium]HOJ83775.1 DUF3795 domain-containing protein [Bacillota bacterium]HOL16580.1 DUF3795 domain-containing protein [Bacillota bacterium]HPZ12013.1 DUF3795 domain-containing protein [Bacillota bacterium]